MKELQKFQNSTFDELTRQKFIEDQNTIMELSGRLQELQNEVNCMNDSKDFQDAESVRSGNSHVTSQPGVFPQHPPFEGLLRPSFVSPRHGAREAAWKLAKNVLKLKEHQRATFFSSPENRCLLASTLKPEER